MLGVLLLPYLRLLLLMGPALWSLAADKGVSWPCLLGLLQLHLLLIPPVTFSGSPGKASSASLYFLLRMPCAFSLE
jgi:hypothetical protein